MTRPPRTLDRLLRRSSRAFPGKRAVVDAERTYTYDELGDRVDAVAGRLAALGVGEGDRVALLSDMHADYTVTWLGCIAAGAIPAPIHTRSSEEDQRTMCRAVEPELLIHRAPHAEVADSLASEVGAAVEPFGLDAGTGFVASAVEAGDPPPAVDRGPDDPATIFFTSGSTGTPRPYVHSHEAMVAAAHIEVTMTDARRTDVALNFFPPSTTAFVILTLPFLAVGATTVAVPRFDPEAVARAIEDHRATTTVMVPTHARKFLEAVDTDAADLSSLETLVCGGEPASGGLLDRMRDEICENVAFGYGNTESFNSCVLLPEEADASNAGSVGRPLPETEIRIVEPGEADASRETEVDELGEVAVRSPMVADGVWEDADDDERERFGEDGWLFTGDLGRRDERGFLYVEGRVDNMILTGGLKVYPERVEPVLRSHPDVTTAVVVGVPDEEWGERVTAFVEVSGELTAEELLAWVEDEGTLAGHQIPKDVVFVEEVPRTPTGKADRERLKREA